MARRKRVRVSAERWSRDAASVWTGMADWRAAHPRATFSEIEAALDERLSRARARLLEDLALASAAADLGEAAAGERPACPGCGGRLEARGQHARELRTSHERTIRLERSYAVCSTCGAGVFPPG